MDLPEFMTKFKLFSLSSLVILGPFTITLSSTVPGAAMFTNLANICPSFNFLKTSLFSGLTGNFSFTSSSSANKVLINLQ